MGCKGWKGHDGNSRVSVRCRNHRLKAEGREGSCGGHGGRSSRSAEKSWLFQDCRCFQSQASIQDSEGASDEEAQRDGELIMHAVRSTCSESNLELFRSRWAASPDLGGALYFLVSFTKL